MATENLPLGEGGWGKNAFIVLPLMLAAGFMLTILMPAMREWLFTNSRWFAFGIAIALLGLATRWLIRQGPTAFPVSITAIYFGLLLLGYWSFETLLSYKLRGYPIALYQQLPSIAAVSRSLAVDAFAGVLLLIGLLLGSRKQRKTRDIARAVSKLGIMAAARYMFVLGLLGAGILVAANKGRLAMFESDVDAVRFRQASGVGFASLLEYCLIPATTLAIAAAVNQRRFRLESAVIVVSGLAVLLLTRAERTPLMLAALAAFLFLVRKAWGVRLSRVIIIGGVLVSAGLFLGLLRLGSEGQALTTETSRVRAVFDISPEVRERAFVYQIYGDELPYRGSEGAASLVVSALPGKVLAFTGFDKRDAYTDVSRQYSSDMRSLGMYLTKKPIRIGLPGELWMYGGAPVLALGMLSFGYIAARCWSHRTADEVGDVLVSVFGSYVIIALIMPLAALVPITLASLVPLCLRRLAPSSPA